MQRLVLLIVAVKLTQVAAEYNAKDVLRTARDINTRFSTQTNVIFNFDGTAAIEANSSDLGIPKIVITHPVDYKFIYALDKEVLAIVHISANSAAPIQASLNKVFYQMHHINVLFVLLDSTNPVPVFQWAWENGFKNAIALFWTERGLTQLAEYKPFPTLRSVNIRSVQESRLQKPMRNFQLHPFRTPLADDPPMLVRYYDGDGKVTYSGVFFKIFELFAKHYNATIEEVVLPRPYPAGVDILEYISAVRDGKVDIGLDPLPRFTEAVLYTDTFFFYNLYLMVPVAKPVDEYLYIVLPFQTWTWAGVLGIHLLFATAICFAYRSATGKWDVGRALLKALCGVLNIPFPHKNHNSRSILLMSVLLCLAGIMLSNMYLAQHSTFLTTYAYEKQINTYEDAVASGLPILSTASEFAICTAFGCAEDILKKIQVVDPELYYKFFRRLNISAIAITDIHHYEFYSFQQSLLRKQLVKIIDKPIASLTPAFIMPLTSPYVSMYSKFNWRLYETGLYSKFSADTYAEAMANGFIAFIKSDGPEISPLSLNRFTLAWLLLIIGYALAAVGLVIENVFFKFGW